MKITINHVHSGKVELTMKEQPKAATGQKKDTMVESEQPPSNNSDKRDKLKWALVGSLMVHPTFRVIRQSCRA